MDFTPLEEFLQQQVAGGVPGCELTVCRDGEILFHSCAGFSDYKKTKPASCLFLHQAHDRHCGHAMPGKGTYFLGRPGGKVSAGFCGCLFAGKWGEGAHKRADHHKASFDHDGGAELSMRYTGFAGSESSVRKRYNHRSVFPGSDESAFGF